MKLLHIWLILATLAYVEVTDTVESSSASPEGPPALPPGTVGPPALPPVIVGPPALPTNTAGPPALPPGKIEPPALPPGTVRPPALPPGTVGPPALPPGKKGPPTLPPGTVGPPALPPGKIGPPALPPGTVGPPALPPGTVGPPALPPGKIGPPALPPGTVGPPALPPVIVGPPALPTNTAGPPALPPGTVGPPALPPALPHSSVVTTTDSHVTLNKMLTVATKAPSLPPVGAPVGNWLDTIDIYNDSLSALDIMTSICPNMQFSCQGNTRDEAVYITDEYDSCCVPCDCSDDCFASGNCCYDKQGGPQYFINDQTATRNGELCLYPAVFYSRGYFFASQIKTNVFYMLISLCAPSYTGDELSKCHFSNLSLIGHYIVPVYSPSTGRNYRNIHCAVCNFDTEKLTPWKPVLSCFQYHQSFSILNGARDILDIMNNILEMQSDCGLEWKPLNNNHKTCIKDERIRNDCVFFSLNARAHRKQELCDNLNIPFGHAGIFYKNVFCFGCIRDYIETIGNDSCYEHVVNNPCALVVDATLATPLVDRRSHTDSAMATNRKEQNTTEYLKCAKGMTYNTLLMTCLTMSCSPGMLQNGDDCVHAVETISGIGLEYRLYLTFSINKEVPSISGVLGHARQFVLHTSDESIYTEEAVIGQMDGNAISFRVQFTKFAKRKINITDDYLNFKTKLSSFSGEFSVKLNNSGYDPVPRMSTQYVSFSDSVQHRCLDVIAMSEVQFCPMVTVTKDNHTEIREDILVVNNVIFDPSDYVVREAYQYAQVCIDTFVSKMSNALQEELSKASPMNQSNLLAILVILMTFRICLFDFWSTVS